MRNIKSKEELYNASLSLENIEENLRMKVVYNLLCFCKRNGATEFEIEFFAKNPDTGGHFVNPELLGKALVCTTLPKGFAKYEKPSKDKELGKDDWCYLHADFNDKFIEWYKKNPLMTWLPFDLNLLDSKDRLIANFTKDHSSIGISYLNKTEGESLKKIVGKHAVKIKIDISKMKKAIYISLASSNKKEKLRDFQRKLWLSGYKFYDRKNTDFYSQVIANPAVKRHITDFDFEVFSKKSYWEPKEVLEIFTKLEERLAEKQESLPKHYSVEIKLPEGDSWTTHGYDRFEIDGKEWFFSCIWELDKATAESQGKKFNLIEENAPFKLDKEYEGKYIGWQKSWTGKQLKFKIASQPIHVRYKYEFEEIKRLCNYAKEKEYKIFMKEGLK